MLSRLDTYPIAEAVVASAAFPLLIDRPSLRIYRPEDWPALATGAKPHSPRYLSLYDGGVHDNFGVTELRWFIECQFDRNARRVTWTPEIRNRWCGSPLVPPVPPAATLIIGIDSSLLRSEGVSPSRPKPRTWDSYVSPLRLTGTAESVDLIMDSSGEQQKMQLRSLIEDISRSGSRQKPGDNPFIAPGTHQYLDIDLEAAYYLSCPRPVPANGVYVVDRGSTVILNSANGATERSRCEGLLGVLAWNETRNLALPRTTEGACKTLDCPAMDALLKPGEGAPNSPRVFPLADGSPSNLVYHQALFDAVRDVPTNFELEHRYVRLLRYAARWAVAHRVWELCTLHHDLVERLPGGAYPVCERPLDPRPIRDDPDPA